MLQLDQIRPEHLDQVQALIQWKAAKDRVVADLVGDLHPDRWVGFRLPEGMLQEFNTDQDFYIEMALQFLSDMKSLLLDSRGLMEPYRGAYAAELLHRERLYMTAQISNMFFHRTDSRFWCLQLFNERSLQVAHSVPWVPWNENCWIFGLKGSAEDEYFSPVLASLHFMDGIRFLEDGETVCLKSRYEKLSAVIDSHRGPMRTLTPTQYARFEPVMTWVGAMYQGFPLRAIREPLPENLELI